MSKNSANWGKRITDLLSQHGLSTRAAEIKCGGIVSSTYIASMMKGKLPQYETALAFLRCFPKKEAIECLKAGGFHLPSEWCGYTCTIIEHEVRRAVIEVLKQKSLNIPQEEMEEVANAVIQTTRDMLLAEE